MEPQKRMYHGTYANFDAFDTSDGGLIFVTPNPKFAQGFTDGKYSQSPIEMAKQERYGSIMPVYVKSENPFDYENIEHIQMIENYLNEVFEGEQDYINDRIKYIKKGRLGLH